MLNSRGKTLINGQIVNDRIYYYVLDALDSNDIDVSAILGIEFERVNYLTTEQLNKLFKYIVKLEIKDL